MGYSGIVWDIWSLMFFRKDPPQTEGRRDADLRIKTSPASTFFSRAPSPRALRCRCAMGRMPHPWAMGTRVLSTVLRVSSDTARLSSPLTDGDARTTVTVLSTAPRAAQRRKSKEGVTATVALFVCGLLLFINHVSTFLHAPLLLCASWCHYSKSSSAVDLLLPPLCLHPKAKRLGLLMAGSSSSSIMLSDPGAFRYPGRLARHASLAAVDAAAPQHDEAALSACDAGKGWDEQGGDPARASAASGSIGWGFS